jgi:hypothetical protein
MRRDLKEAEMTAINTPVRLSPATKVGDSEPAERLLSPQRRHGRRCHRSVRSSTAKRADFRA